MAQLEKLNSSQKLILKNAQNMYAAGHFEQALQLYQVLIQQIPTVIDLYLAVGKIFLQLSRWDLAQEIFQVALKIQPDSQRVLENLAQTFKLSGDLAAYLQALEYLTAHYPENTLLYQAYRACALEEQACYTEALVAYQQLLLNPDLPQRLYWELKALLTFPYIPQNHQEMSEYKLRVEEGLSQFLNRKLPQLQENLSDLGPWLSLWSSVNFSAYHGYSSLKMRQLFAQLFQALLPPIPPRVKQESSLIVGILIAGGAALRTLKGIITRLNFAVEIQVKIYCLDLAAFHALKPELQKLNWELICLNQNYWDTLMILREAACDVLFFTEINPHLLLNWLANYRLAPIQFTFWNNGASSARKTIDYFISSVFFEPPFAQNEYSEKLILFESIPAWYEPVQKPEKLYTREDFGFDSTMRIYLCPHLMFKIHPDLDGLLRQILAKDPRAQIVFLTYPDRIWLRAALLKRFETTLAKELDRIWFLPYLDKTAYLSLICLADVVLDPPHFSGGLSSLDVLALGIPTVTWPGQFMVGRITAGFYQKMDLPDCIVDSESAYIELAVKLANQPEYRQIISTKILERVEGLFADKLALREFEVFFTRVIAESQHVKN